MAQRGKQPIPKTQREISISQHEPSVNPDTGVSRGNPNDAANLNNRGEYLRGMGDGMSDTIPANIDNVQEAALSDGEFVIPADVVSHLGNGSSNAGAKRLYAMMDKIRKERTGKEKQAPAVNVNKVMPA